MEMPFYSIKTLDKGNDMSSRKSTEDRITAKYNGLITGLQDLTGGDKPSFLFPILSRLLFRHLSNDPMDAVREKDIRRFRKLH